LEKEEITNSDLLDKDQISNFAAILKYFKGFIPDSWIPITNAGGSVGNRLRFMRNKK
jgi:hypothetical protein